MKRIICLLCFAALLLPSVALAKPSASAVKSVLDHFSDGTEPILFDYQFCSEIGKDGKNKNKCVDKLNPRSLKHSSKVYIWVSFMVPKNTTSKLLVQFSNGGRTLKTRDINLSESLRFSTWALVPTNKAGDWKIIIDQDNKGNFSTLSTLNYNISDN